MTRHQPANTPPHLVLSWLSWVASTRSLNEGGKGHTHQFFVHFCFDVSGQSEKRLWKEDILRVAVKGYMEPGWGDRGCGTVLFYRPTR